MNERLKKRKNWLGKKAKTLIEIQTKNKKGSCIIQILKNELKHK